MSVTSQAGRVGFGIQAGGAKGGAVSTWYRHKALAVGLGPNVGKDYAPPEIDGGNNPTGAYKTMAFYGGRLTLTPRLEGDLGWLLLGLTGYVSSAANETTGYRHTFSQAPEASGGAIYIPWMGFRRLIPSRDALNNLGEIGEDCVISAASFNLPAVAPLSMDMSILGRTFRFDNDPELWTWADVAEDYDSVPVSMTGTGLVLPNWAPGGGQPLPIVSARITVNNNSTTPQQEMIIGDYFPEDYTVRQRSVAIEATYKWRDPDFYRFIINGGDPAELEFKPCIQYTDFELEVETPCDIDEGVVNYPWKLRFEAPRVDWQYDPIQLAGDELLMMGVTGLAIESSTTLPEDYFKIILDNAQESYVMPV